MYLLPDLGRIDTGGRWCSPKMKEGYHEKQESKIIVDSHMHVGCRHMLSLQQTNRQDSGKRTGTGVFGGGQAKAKEPE